MANLASVALAAVRRRRTTSFLGRLLFRDRSETAGARSFAASSPSACQLGAGGWSLAPADDQIVLQCFEHFRHVEKASARRLGTNSTISLTWAMRPRRRKARGHDGVLFADRLFRSSRTVELVGWRWGDKHLDRTTRTPLPAQSPSPLPCFLNAPSADLQIGTGAITSG